MNLNLEIKQISTEETLDLRRRVLKPFLTESECINPGDELTSTFHYGLFLNHKLVTIATFVQEAHPEFRSALPYRLRGMATDREHHQKGYGKAVLMHGLRELKKINCDFIWFNARVVAFPFYEKLGFMFHGPLFDLKDIGPHKVMYKYLDHR